MNRAVFFLLFLALVSLPTSWCRAEAGPVESYVSEWVLGGMNPPAETCTEQIGYLGEFRPNGNPRALDEAIDAECIAKTNPRTNEPPLLIRGCFLSLPCDDELLYNPDTKPVCDCDLFFCNPANVEIFEQGVETIFELSNLFN